ncbi:MAG: secretin N-terminal domain-containing protein [Verrucomicrobiales bacterium]|nr:secretin N-terminal domain-containing protein [Verrucomicrobiales bacterium]
MKLPRRPFRLPSPAGLLLLTMLGFVGTAFRPVHAESPRESQSQARRNPDKRVEAWKALDQELRDTRWPVLPEIRPDLPTPAPPQRELLPAEAPRLFSFSAAGIELKTALALFAKANGLNVVPDPDVEGIVTLEVHDLPLAAMMRALLEAADCAWSEESGLIRIRTSETRSFTIDYLRLQRKGLGQNSATLAAGTTGGGTTVAGSGSGGGSTGSGTASGSTGGAGGSTVQLTAENSINFWTELRDDISRLLTPRGRDAMAINSTAGLIQVTDRPAALGRVERYLHGLQDSVHRQVDIEATLYDVTLNDQFEFGIDWEEVIRTSGGAFGIAGNPMITRPLGGFDLSPATLSLAFNNSQAKVVVKALQEQGEVRVISKPRVRALNNQTALIKVGTEMPFFQNQSTIIPGGGTTPGASAVIEQDTVLTVTVGTILAITPQVSENDWVTLDISPVLTSLLETKLSPNGSTTAPVLDIKQASSLIRIRSGTTIALGGLIQTESAKHRRKIPGLGDIPWLGRLFQGDFDARRKKELVMLITPTIVP